MNANLVKNVLRENGPLSEELLVTICMREGGQTDPEWRAAFAAMLTADDLTAVEYLKPCGEKSGLVYFHPGCRFRVLNFR